MNIDLESLTASGISGWDVLFAILAVIAAWILSVIVGKSIRAVAGRTPGITPAVAGFVARFAKYSIILIGVGVGFAFLGASIQPLLAVAIILAVIIALVLRGVADNFAAGVLLQTRHPIEIGDEIEAGGHTGTVTELNARAVVLHTLDGRTVHVPNATMLQDPIINHSDRGARRSEVMVRMTRDADHSDADLLELIASVASTTPGVHAERPARALALAASPARVTAKVQFWHDPLVGPAVSSRVVQEVSAALIAAAIAGTVTSEDTDPPLVPADPV